MTKKTMPKKTTKQKTTAFYELQKLVFFNSNKIPHLIEVDRELKEWTYMGWMPALNNNKRHAVKVIE